MCVFWALFSNWRHCVYVLINFEWRVMSNNLISFLLLQYLCENTFNKWLDLRNALISEKINYMQFPHDNEWYIIHWMDRMKNFANKSVSLLWFSGGSQAESLFNRIAEQKNWEKSTTPENEKRQQQQQQIISFNVRKLKCVVKVLQFLRMK